MDAELIEAEYRPIVTRIARRLARRVPEHMMAQEDLEAVGKLGLLGAINTYRPELGVPFRPYALRRITGQMIDAVRKLDPVPHPTRRVLREAERAGERLSQRLGRQCTDEELSNEIGVHPEAIRILRNRVAAMAPPRHIDERVAGDEHDPLTLGDTVNGGGDPLEHLTQAEDARSLVRRLLRDLTPLEIQVALFFHVDKADMAWISQRLGISLMEAWAIVGDVQRRLNPPLQEAAS